MRPHEPNGARSMCAVVAAAMITLAARAADSGTPYVWWEGEDATDTNFPARSAFATATFRDTAHLLSEGDWLSNSGPRAGAEAYAAYDVDIPAEATYDLWSR